MHEWKDISVIKRPMYLDRLSVPHDVVVVDVTSRTADREFLELSPFHLGPLNLSDAGCCNIFENAWQYLKVYDQHIDSSGEPNSEWHLWKSRGFSLTRANRFPMEKGKKPRYHFYDNEKLDIFRAREELYFPNYRDLVRRTSAFQKLKAIAGSTKKKIVLLDFDGDDAIGNEKSMRSVLKDPAKSMAHAYILKAMLCYGDNIEIRDLPGRFESEKPDRNSSSMQLDIFG